MPPLSPRKLDFLENYSYAAPWAKSLPGPCHVGFIILIWIDPNHLEELYIKIYIYIWYWKSMEHIHVYICIQYIHVIYIYISYIYIYAYNLSWFILGSQYCYSEQWSPNPGWLAMSLGLVLSNIFGIIIRNQRNGMTESVGNSSRECRH